VLIAYIVSNIYRINLYTWVSVSKLVQIKFVQIKFVQYRITCYLNLENSYQNFIPRCLGIRTEVWVSVSKLVLIKFVWMVNNHLGSRFPNNSDTSRYPNCSVLCVVRWHREQEAVIWGLSLVILPRGSQYLFLYLVVDILIYSLTKNTF